MPRSNRDPALAAPTINKRITHLRDGRSSLGRAAHASGAPCDSARRRLHAACRLLGGLQQQTRARQG